VRFAIHARFVARLQQALQLPHRRSAAGGVAMSCPPGGKHTFRFCHECEADKKKGGRAALLPW
jgi:hypothetical protein